MVFSKTAYGSYEISYAPLWLQPEHLKLDYDLLFFEVRTIVPQYAEITVNKTTRQKAFVHRFKGKVIYWPDFLLQIHSVEMLPDALQKIRIKPLDYAGELYVDFEFMKPIMMQQEWMMVELQDKNFKAIENGWIQWNKNGRSLISYYLLS